MTREEKRRQIIKEIMMCSGEVSRSDFYRILPDSRSNAVSLALLSAELNIHPGVLRQWCWELRVMKEPDGTVWKGYQTKLPEGESTGHRTKNIERR